MTMPELMETRFRVRPAVIDGLLPAGTYLLAGAPKIGKSFLVLQMAYQVSMGEPFLGFSSRQGTVLYLALEDTNADLIRREVPKIERLKILREKAYRQLELLKKNQDTIEALKKNLIEDTETNG